MAYQATHWAWELPLPTSQKFTLIALADMADESFTCYPGQEKLARMIGASVDTVQRSVKSLEASGLIERQERRRNDGYRTSDRYKLHVGNSPRNLRPKNLTPQSAESHTANSPDLTPQGAGVITSKNHQDESPDNSSLQPAGRNSDKPKKKRAAPVFSDDVKRLAQLLADRVEANGHPVGVIGKHWWYPIDRLLRIDNYSVHQVEWMIGWSTQHEFWSANIRSPRKLREQFSMLAAQAKRDAEKARRAATGADRPLSNVEQNLARFAEKHGGDALAAN